MERVFQDDHGIVDALNGAVFSSVKKLIQESDGDVILIWFHCISSQCWYRVFIDGTYCGIDKHLEDNSQDDLDDNVSLVDISDLFIGKTIKKAEVKFNDLPGNYISFELATEETFFKLICEVQEGDCVILNG